MTSTKALALFFLSIFLFQNSVFSQVSISGRVTDKDNGEAIAMANIFIAYSTIGTTSDNEGNFELKNVPEGDYELVISHIAYKNTVREVRVNQDRSSLDIQLSPFKRVLEEITILEKKDKAWKRNFKKFQGAFLGATKNARSCEIVNPWVIDFEKDEKGTFRASASELIQIRNNALGYKITFFLQSFTMKRGVVQYSGKPKFEILIADSDKQKKSWKKNRIKTYNGSQRHFFTSLVTNSLNEDGFEIYMAKLNSKRSGFEVTTVARPSNIFFPNRDGSTYSFHVNEFLKIIYTKEKEENNYISQLDVPDNNSIIPVISKQQTIGRDRGEKEPIDHRSSNFQTSYMFLRKKTMQLYSNGLPANPEYIQEYGYWAWERVAELMPFDYVVE